MTDSERDEKIIQLHQAVLGISGTEAKGLLGQVQEMAEVLSTLPCTESSKRLKILENWQKEIANNSQFRSREGLRLWHGILLIIATALATGLATLAVNGMTR